MKKYLSLFLILLSISVYHIPASAQTPDVIINGRHSIVSDNVLLLNNSAYVPMRELFENIGADVSWDNVTQSATATFKNYTLKFKIGSNAIIKNGEQHRVENHCTLIDGKTYIPLRNALELLGFIVNWNEKEQNIEISPPAVNDEISDNETPEISDNNEFEIKVLELINIERRKNGLNDLVSDNNLSIVARAHSQDMYERNFFSHTNPDGFSPFDRMKNYGISYRYAAENIAAGQSSPDEVVTSWMNSAGHRENILNPNFNKIGIGYFNSGKNYVHYWTQCFTD